MSKEMVRVCTSKIREVLRDEGKGITASEASRRIGASSDYLGDAMRDSHNGFTRISKDRLVKFCKEFNVGYVYMTTRKYTKPDQKQEPQVPPVSEMTSTQAFYNLIASIATAFTNFQQDLMAIKEE